MDEQKSDRVLAFDTLYTSNQIQMLKIFFPYAEENMQKNLAIFIKYMEFQYTLSFFQKKDAQINICSDKTTPPPMEELLEEITYYCDDSQKQQLKQMKNFQNTMQMFQTMKPLMEMMSTLSSEDDANGDGANPDGMSQMLKGMLSPEQQAMFEMFNQTME